MKQNKTKPNYLDYRPSLRDNVQLHTDDEGKLILLITNKGISNRIAQKLFRKPKITSITIDSYGEFIWKRIDGKNTIYDIGCMIRDEFGEEAEPLYERLCMYFRTIQNNELIDMNL